MTQLDLLDHIRTLPEPRGETYVPKRDRKRLCAQALLVQIFMEDGRWHTLGEIRQATGAPEASASARLRDLRRAGFTIEREYVERGLFKYRMAGGR